MFVNEKRIRYFQKKQDPGGPIFYWMSRDQRVQDNWALLYARQVALARKQPFAVVFTLTPHFQNARQRHYRFLLDGLRYIESELRDLGIGFWLEIGPPAKTLASMAHQCHAGLIVTDFDPLRIKRQWKQEACQNIEAEMIEVDAHNIVPAWEASHKLEFAARTIRPRIHRLLPEFLEPFPVVEPLPSGLHLDVPQVDWEKINQRFLSDPEVSHSERIISGPQAALNTLNKFVESGLNEYDSLRNDPLAEGQSGLSPYFHFGQLAPQRAALSVSSAKHAQAKDKEVFLEEMIVRRELSDNFCWYQQHYDSIEGAADWARKTLEEHRRDPRPFIYSYKSFALAQTHSALWNAAQQEMIKTGKMHGYMRMYWAKKIFEWSSSPEDALAIALRLNDSYQLDGRDPNGYTGVMWSICGVHDRAFKERPVFGKIRYMNEAGCRRKFDVDRYIARWA